MTEFTVPYTGAPNLTHRRTATTAQTPSTTPNGQAPCKNP